MYYSFFRDIFCSKITTVAILVFFSQSVVTAQTSYRFDFGDGPVAKGYIQVLPNSIYNANTGYGFDLNSTVRAVNYKGKKPLTDDYITSENPFYFSVKLPDGNYHVKLLLGDTKGASTTTIKAECRRLMALKVNTSNGSIKEENFVVHVKDSMIKPANIKVKLKSREHEYLHWDNKLTLEFSNQAPKICAIEITPDTSSPTIFLAGNSTVVDQAQEPWAAWGQMFPSFFQPKVAIANYAESGETMKAFAGERRLEKIWSIAKPGDYLFIEFTHNDQKPGSNHLDPFTTYQQTIREWAKAAKERGIQPVLVTSMHRRNFDSAGHIVNTLLEYPAAMRQVAEQDNLPLIDLNAMSKILYETWGPEKSIKAFVHYAANSFPNQPNEIKDNTHFSTYGAYELAKCVVTGIRQNIPALAKLLKKDLPAFKPAEPSPFEAWNWPLSISSNLVKPDGN